jgi:hypothetical protein
LVNILYLWSINVKIVKKKINRALYVSRLSSQDNNVIATCHYCNPTGNNTNAVGGHEVYDGGAFRVVLADKIVGHAIAVTFTTLTMSQQIFK